MENKLKNLDEKMNSTILKDIQFQKKNKLAVLEKVDQGVSKRRIFKPYLNLILSSTVTSALLIGLFLFSAGQMGLFGDSDTAAPTDTNEDELVPQKNVKEKSSTIFEPGKQKENYDDMSKEEVLTKLLNTVDYFETAKGRFKTQDIYRDGSSNTSFIEYKVILNDEPAGYSKTIDSDGKTVTHSTFFNNGLIWEVNEEKKSFQKMKYDQRQSYGDFLSIEEAFSVDQEGINVTKYRGRPLIGIAQNSLFPYEIASNYTRDLNMWEIEQQNEGLIGHNTIVIKGKLNKYAKEKHSSASFRFWVDKDTGILMKYETYNHKGEIVNYLHPEELIINGPINRKDLEPNLEGYEEFVFEKPEVDPREEEIVHVAGAKSFDEETSGELKKVIGKMRAEIPFLKEINHPDLQLFSAGYETYREFKIGYLDYMKKTDEKESSQFISIRVHHKDSYVRETGSFEMEGGKVLQSFELGGINWEGSILKEEEFSISNLRGKIGDYIYDISAQDLTLEETREFLNNLE